MAERLPSLDRVIGALLLGPASIDDLSRMLDLSRSTVVDVLGDLESRGTVFEFRKKVWGGNRPKRMFDLS